MTEPYKLTATEALSLMKSGKLTVTEYANSLLSRISTRDTHTVAWTYLDSTTILASAAILDALPPSSRGPLHGLPIAVKDVILTADLPTSYNSAIYTGDKALKGVDAAPIIALRASGALIFGKTTTTEFATTSRGGPSRNPHGGVEGWERTPGGSSSGSGVVVGDFQAPVALGTQTGGSTIRPGSCKFDILRAMVPISDVFMS